MSDPADDEQRGGEQAEAVRTLMDEQLKAARAEVFRAYRRAQEQGRRLAEPEHGAAGRQRRTAS